MKLKSIHNLETGLKIYIGISEISINLEKLSPKILLNLNHYVDTNYNKSFFQILNNSFILNSDHVYSACYFAYNAFLSDNNISKSKEIELLLYLSVNRQIKIAIRDFGLPIDTKRNLNAILCLGSFQNNLDIIYEDLKDKIKFHEVSFELDKYSFDKFTHIKRYFDIYDNQIKVLLKSYNLNLNDDNIYQIPLNSLYSALSDIIREKMVLLSVEKTNLN